LVRLLLIVAIIALVYWLLKGYRRNLESRQERGAVREIENMVRCAHCGMHLPRGESVSAGGEFYCSAEHRRLHEIQP